MCGRYTFTANSQALMERYDLQDIPFSFDEGAEIFPTNTVPVVLPGKRSGLFYWGLTPAFAKRPLINAREETVLEKVTFREPFQANRCLIPATSFFEWEKRGDKKQKREISVKHLSIFSIAGFYDWYEGENGEKRPAFILLTTEANEQMKNIHHRMPVILEKEDEERYISQQTAIEDIQQLLHPFNGELIIH